MARLTPLNSSNTPPGSIPLPVLEAKIDRWIESRI